MVRERVFTFLIGLLFGISLSRIGFTSWGEVHRMFVFDDLRLLLTFACAVALLAPGWWVFHRVGMSAWIKRAIHPGTVAGGALFGIGWAVSGACPSIALVQLGEGQLGAAWTLLGMFLGNYLYSVIHPRAFGWSQGSCIDE